MQLAEVVATHVPSPPGTILAEEAGMLGEDHVREILARVQRGDGIKTIARKLGVDRNTVKRWQRLGAWQPRQQGPRRRQLDPFAPFLAQRGPEVGWNGSISEPPLFISSSENTEYFT